MTEKEKMQRQMLYDANYDSQLLEERKVAKDLCYEYNRCVHLMKNHSRH